MRASFLRGLLLNAGSAGTVALVGLVRNVLVARFMGPASYGTWQICLIALRLAGELHLGALHALSIDGPVLRGAGRPEEARRVEQRTLGVASLLGAAGGIVAALVLRVHGGPGLGTAALLLAAAVFSQQVFQAHAVLLQSRRQFGRMALLQAGFSVGHLAALLLLLPGRYISGALAAWVAGALAGVIAVRASTRDPIPVPLRPLPSGGLDAVRRGFPAYVVGALFVLLFQVDRMAIGAVLGKEELGLYGVLSLGGTALLFFPTVLAAVLWPLAGEHFGRSGREARALRPLALGTLRALGLVLAAALVLVSQGTEALVVHALPGYRPALDALRIYLPGVVLLGLAHPLRLLVVTAGGERDLVRLLLAVLLLAGVLEVGAAAGGLGKEGVAAAATLAGCLLFAGSLRLAARLLGIGRDVVRAGLECGGLLALALLVDLVLGRAGPPLSTLPGVLLRLGLPALALLGAGVAAMRIRERLPEDPGVD